MHAIGRADLAECAAGTFHDVRHPERSTDFDELSSRRGHLLAQGKGVQHQQYGRRVVVDDGRRWGTGQAAERGLDVVVAIAALAGFEVELEVARRACRGKDGVDGFLRKGSAAQVGVEDRPGQIEDALE